jgi:hypothetical protein
LMGKITCESVNVKSVLRFFRQENPLKRKLGTT